MNGALNRKLKMGLVGGGPGSFIGKVHSIAACLDHRAEVVAGAFSSQPERSLLAATDYDVTADRAYGSYCEMFEKETLLPAGKRIDFVTVATPNHLHFPVAMAALEAGFHVVCDKPMTFDLNEAQQLAKQVEQSKLVFAVTYNYSGYPLIRQAREMIQAGELGEVQAIRTNYIQGWLRSQVEKTDHKQAAWRTDPKQSGAAGCFGDIATHAFQLGNYISGLSAESISCQLRTFVSGRELDDYGTAIIKYDNGALGTVTASQISHGRENDLSIEIDGTLGSLIWRQENPNELILRCNGKPHQIYTRDPSSDYVNSAGATACRLPKGHPEGFFEAFANVYTAIFDDIIDHASGTPTTRNNKIYPTIQDGVEGMQFIQQAVASSQQNGAWLPLH